MGLFSEIVKHLEGGTRPQPGELTAAAEAADKAHEAPAEDAQDANKPAEG